MTSIIIDLYAVAKAMLVGPNSALKLKTAPKSLEPLTRFIVEKMVDEEKTPYEIAEVVVLTTIMAMKDHETKKKALMDFLGTPMVIEAFLMRGMPSPYPMEMDLAERRHMLPSWMDERLLGLIPTVLQTPEGPEWDEESKAEVHYVAQLLWNQDLLHAKEHGVWVSREHSRLLREFKKTNRASTTSTTKTKS